MNQDNFRTFIAIELDSILRLEINDLQERLKEIQADIRWVEAKNIHLTLKFIGDVPLASMQNLCQAITQAVKDFSCFEFQLSHGGWFPERAHPRILWIGIDAGSDHLRRLARSLSTHVSSFCQSTQNEDFSPHVTIGRVRSNKNIAKLLPQLSALNPEFHQKQKVQSIVLFKSILSSSGSQYSKIKEFKLN